MKAKNKKKSILKRQKVKFYQRLINLLGNRWALSAFTAVLGAIYFNFYGVTQISHLIPFSSQHKNSVPIIWNIVLKETGNSTLSDSGKSLVQEKAKTKLRTGDEKELKKIAKDLHALGFLESVLARRLEPHTLELIIKSYQPIYLVKADKLRYLSSEGVVFGDPRKNYFKIEPEPTYIVDLFDRKSGSWNFYNNSSLILEQKERVLVDQVLNLRGVLRDNNIIAEKIIVDRYRGFSLILKDTNTEVILGSKDFASRVVRLATVTRNLEKKGIQAERIELDYEGKAFIKERKI